MNTQKTGDELRCSGQVTVPVQLVLRVLSFIHWC